MSKNGNFFYPTEPVVRTGIYNAELADALYAMSIYFSDNNTERLFDRLDDGEFVVYDAPFKHGIYKPQEWRKEFGRFVQKEYINYYREQEYVIFSRDNIGIDGGLEFMYREIYVKIPSVWLLVASYLIAGKKIPNSFKSEVVQAAVGTPYNPILTMKRHERNERRKEILKVEQEHLLTNIDWYSEQTRKILAEKTHRDAVCKKETEKMWRTV